MAWNGAAVVAAGADGLLAAEPDAAGLVLPPLEDAELLLLLAQPAAAIPTKAAHTAARATYRPIPATSAIPPVLAMIVAAPGLGRRGGMGRLTPPRRSWRDRHFLSRVIHRPIVVVP